MRKFFYPSSIAVFGVASNSRNLARNIVSNCREMGFKGAIHPVGKKSGKVCGIDIITDPGSLPEGIDLAVILVPATAVAGILDICGQKGILQAVISSGGFREYVEEDNNAEREVLLAAKKHGIRFIGPNCLGIICPGSGLCTPFNPFRPSVFKKGPVSIFVQSGGVTTQSAYMFSEEHVGFSKIISGGNKLDINEIDILEYLLEDEDTEQIYFYLESIENGRELMRLAGASKKPVIIFKSNTSRLSSEIAMSHTAALSNNERIVDGALKQAGILRTNSIHDMTVCARALQLPPLRGDRLVVIAVSGGFSVIVGDACEEYGFTCPPLPHDLMNKIESFRRGGVIRMSNPMDFGDVHDIKALVFALEQCLALEDIDGLVLMFVYEPDMEKVFGPGMGSPRDIQTFLKKMCEETNKPIAFSFISENRYINDFKKNEIFPVFDDPVESVRALWMLRHYWRNRGANGNSAV